MTLENSVSNSRQLTSRNGLIQAQDADAYATTPSSDPTLRLGGISSAGNTQDAQIGEVIIWEGPITVEERQLIEGYLAWKWSIPIEDPLHPYASGSPGAPCP